MSKRDRAARAKGAPDAADSVVDDLETDLPSDDDAELRPQGKRSARGRRAASDGGSSVAVAERKKDAPESASANPFVRIWTFLKEVVAELKKVIWPTRREMITYTIVVLAFVVIMTAFIAGIDIAFGKGVLWLFG
ncbi:MAG: preprotein translocase subunit SecE [Gordonia sp.]|uniref:preprotein translocase subunit SecE n=1 Tax=Gordonia sp. (in: high G+C Gram-positive bacteria) TaxID=84139 RepID=UPI001DC43DBD|nr:preprotein translocase subunit SecE [Gordonia sp. (in: high G+C Gram-positive bacteria)]MCB1294335.1 preprotein translocase subunit SecE [Gordonia sp. (in: high G+C Gram-positive bacteria)]HQV17788.1 preprotein translocase subunit SecE [Gordonia sp. (in: high G+C Gram-positive bacteria)]